MVPRVVQDAGYTAVGLGVLALQQVNMRRRDVARRVSNRLESLPRVPGPIGGLIEAGRARIAEALRP